ncbi:extracellular solute-binding protein [Aureimonas frigidaquae]|uniref:extracellular solute-binding protein n=1 Tax=Aureimonas frigidaquae TaxID=424757 RepID=UPI000780A8A3|nr:extracellular solute-binding protein [Aureimonas frigidaquae]
MTGFWLSRRGFNGLLLSGAAAGLTAPRRAFAGNAADTPLHGLSAFGELAYAPNYTQFAYANPDAPTGGRMVMTVPNWILNQAPDTFDTLNTLVLQGNAPPRMEKLYDSLMVSSLDEPDAIYCALAQTVTMSADANSFTFALRPEARFATGEPVTAEDVVFSYETLKADGHPSLVMALAEVTSITALDAGTVRLVFSGRQTVPAALGAMAGIPILRKGFFDARSFARVTMEEIPGSGRYRVGRYEAGRYIEYERRADYWAADLPFARGLDHLQTLRIEFYRDRQAALQAFKKGDVTCREEFTTKAWATEYDIPAVRDGRIVRKEFPDNRQPRFQCWAFNQRRARFADPRVRRALNLCFDFEWTNANLMFGLRRHANSCFEGSEFVAEGAPSAQERAILEPLAADLPQEVFGPVWVQPVSDGSGFDRALLRDASRLLAAAGWVRKGEHLIDAAGETLRVEYMINDPEQTRVYGKMIGNMRAIGVDADFRLVDAAQYQARQNSFDFDMMLSAFQLSATPTPEGLKLFFGSGTREMQGGYNYPGMASPAVDAIIARVGAAQSRDELVVLMRCLDRILRARLDWVPNIAASSRNVAYWDMFGMLPKKPDYGFPVESLWWYEEEKAKAIGRA